MSTPNDSKMKVQISFNAKKLKNVAGAFKGTSDPYAVVTLMTTEHGKKPTVLGKTEVIKNSLNPSWIKFFILDFELGAPIHITVSIFDEIRKSENKSMGSAMFEVGKVLGSKGNVMAKKIRGGGTLYARVEKCTGSGSLKLKMKGQKLTNTEGFMRKSDPFFEVCRKVDNPREPTWNNVFRSGVVQDNLSPVWNEASIDLGILCDGNMDRPISIVVYDYESNGKHVLMGSYETTVGKLVKTSRFEIKKKGKDKGTIIIENAKVVGVNLQSKMEAVSLNTGTQAPVAPTGKPNFIDYISGGCELNLCMAIDFTGSNGDPRKPGTLHYMAKDGSRNDYEKVILSLGSILANYDSDQKYPVWGFGAKYGGVVRHCFQVGPGPEVSGVDGVLDAYHKVFKSGLIMSGPTVIVEVVQLAAARAISAQEAAKAKGEQIYTILLILTDGSVSDINATVRALDEVSDAPLSVIIIGIGQADFGGMRFIDDHKTSGKRDIAQFVEFNQCNSSVQKFTAQSLNELPEQLVGYFTSHGIMPLSSVHRDDEEIAVMPVDDDEEIDLSLEFDDDGEIVVAGGGEVKSQAF